MKIHFNQLADINSFDVLVGNLSVAKIFYDSVKNHYSVYSEIYKKYLDETITSEENAKVCVKHHLMDIFSDIDIGEVKVRHEGCKELPHLLESEVAIIKKHLSRHKYFKNITDDNTAMVDFCKHYGWIFKEFYCTQCCKRRGICKHSIDLINGAIEDNPEGLK